MKNQSLIEAYKQVWVKSQGFRIGHENKPELKLAFDTLATFPFVSVSHLMSDYVRETLQDQLGFLGAPYTTSQLEAIDRLLDRYPTDKVVIDNLNKVNQLVDSLYTLLDQEVVLVHQVSSQVAELINQVYLIPPTYLWETLPKTYALVTTLLDEVRTNWFRTHHGLTSLKDYLKLHMENQTLPHYSMEEQMVKDITLLLQWNYPHPEVIFAIEKAKQHLDIKYGRTEASKLFISDVYYKIEKLLEEGEKIDFLVKDWFRTYRFGEVKVDKEALTPEAKAEALYQRLKEEVTTWQLYGRNKQTLSEVLAKVQQTPSGLLFRFTDLRHLVKQAQKALLQ